MRNHIFALLIVGAVCLVDTAGQYPYGSIERIGFILLAYWLALVAHKTTKQVPPKPPTNTERG